jgi:hypothetical protein
LVVVVVGAGRATVVVVVGTWYATTWDVDRDGGGATVVLVAGGAVVVVVGAWYATRCERSLTPSARVVPAADAARPLCSCAPGAA